MNQLSFNNTSFGNLSATKKRQQTVSPYSNYPKRHWKPQKISSKFFKFHNKPDVFSTSKSLGIKDYTNIVNERSFKFGFLDIQQARKAHNASSKNDKNTQRNMFLFSKKEKIMTTSTTSPPPTKHRQRRKPSVFVQEVKPQKKEIPIQTVNYYDFPKPPKKKRPVSSYLTTKKFQKKRKKIRGKSRRFRTMGSICNEDSHVSTSSLHQKRKAERLASINYPKFSKKPKTKKLKILVIKKDDSLSRLVTSQDHRFASMFTTNYGHRLTNSFNPEGVTVRSPFLGPPQNNIKKRPNSAIKSRPILKLGAWKSHKKPKHNQKQLDQNHGMIGMGDQDDSHLSLEEYLKNN